jgi:hypothetical protein
VRFLRTIGLILALLALVSCSSSGTTAKSATAATHATQRPITRGELIGWYPMAYLATNPESQSLQVRTQAAVG